MGITPIEMYTMIPKSQEAGSVKQGEAARLASQESGAVNQLNNEIRQRSMQTVKATQSENPEYRYDAREKGNGSYNGDSKSKKKKQEKKQEENSIRMRGFDIRV